MAIETFDFESLVHIGQRPIMDPARQQKRRFSFEGPGLSVSVHPEEWAAIAKLGGFPWWELRRRDGEDGVFVDAIALPGSPEGRTLVREAVARGWIEPDHRAWRVSYLDEETDEERYFHADSLEDAEYEAEELPGATISLVTTSVPLPPLQRRWSRHFTQPLIADMAEEFASLQILESRGYDGAWWDERLDPDALSAPRGVIFVWRLPAWEALPLPPE